LAEPRPKGQYLCEEIAALRHMFDGCVLDERIEQSHREHGIAELALSGLHLVSEIDQG
jgi:hypothetical protein